MKTRQDIVRQLEEWRGSPEGNWHNSAAYVDAQIEFLLKLLTDVDILTEEQMPF